MRQTRGAFPRSARASRDGDGALPISNFQSVHAKKSLEPPQHEMLSGKT